MRMGSCAACVVLIAILADCGAGTPAQQPVGFVNETQHSDADLSAIWKAAQESVANQIDLNPVERINSDVAPEILPGDSRALTAMPHQLEVADETDISSQAYFVATGIRRVDPTGMIACPSPCNVRYASAYSLYKPEVTKYAASWEFEGNNFSVILEYEFENHILNALGYDMRWR